MFPIALGVLYCKPSESFEHMILAQIKQAQEQQGAGDLNALMRKGHTWTVE